MGCTGSVSDRVSIFNGIHGSEQVTAAILIHCFWVQVLLHSWRMCPSWAERCEASACALSSAWWRYASIHSWASF